jgi:hypothetical protein
MVEVRRGDPFIKEEGASDQGGMSIAGCDLPYWDFWDKEQLIQG